MERVELAARLGGQTLDGGDDTAAVVIMERDAVAFQAALARAVGGAGPVFLADPGWEEKERSALAAAVAQADAGPADGRGWLMIPTGGSSGQLKFARHDGATLAAAVAGLARGLGVEKIDAVSLLPPHTIGGLMAWLRAALTGGRFSTGEVAGVLAGCRPSPLGWLSLVPTQLSRLLADPAAVTWLREFNGIFVGGGPLWPSLVEAAARADLPLAPAYGATETAAMVTVLRPEEFRAGRRGCGGALPHAEVTLGEEGDIAVRSASLFRGYWPERRDETQAWASGDWGEWDDHGGLVVGGRRDDLIITGGKKVDPGEVEAVAREWAEGRDLAVMGLPHADWGQAVVMAYDAGRGPWDVGPVEMAWRERLARYKHPKEVRGITPWPRTSAGKLDRAELRRRWAEG